MDGSSLPFKPHVDARSALTKGPTFEVGNGPPGRTLNDTAGPCRIGIKGSTDGFGVFRPVGGHVPETTRSDYLCNGIDDRRLDESTFMVASLGPRVGEEGPYSAELTRQLRQYFECVGFHHENVLEPLGGDQIDEVTDSWGVNVDRQNRGVGEGLCEFDYGSSRAKTNIKNDGPRRSPNGIESLERNEWAV